MPVAGFRFAGVSAGLKSEAGSLDLGLIVADQPATAAAVFTTNRVKAAPVIVASERVKAGRLRAIVVNSGSANCFSGKAGLKLARDSCEALAAEIACAPELVAPCSTGVIGHLYDLEKYRAGMRAAVRELDADRLDNFARAIMTTDTRPKVASVVFKAGRTTITVAGAAKGSGMLEPRMATMLAFIVTDAAVPAPRLRQTLARALPSSFNAITVDGDMSTNDTLMLLAGGAAGNGRLQEREAARLDQAVTEVARALAHELVSDGEGAGKLVTVAVRGARSPADAERIARAIANSPLVKTAFFGNDPNVGRILMAAGKAGVAFDPDRLELRVGGVRLASRGALMVDALAAAASKMREREFSVILDLKLGKARAEITTCDLTYDYVKINAEYTT
ncbi:MAG: bifunctional glutamate N-acetyltransferase/amino-acid acetyltransferase ArgJ [Candidatus Binataceae bacterium]